ncbi:hypothetical protein X777_13774 [Ooceraea biroi]|uniref:HTH iclR-type domain-containing protein n=1 Tax=Ooceraea biroi TaxID=2015173 RepID=A0A026VYD6_OOCBI|nr:hypothetical protein X777_13774 [Ooceraea biroi]
MIHFNPHISIRQIEHDLGIPRSTVHRMLVSVQYHPYHINLVQELNENDYRLRAQFCRWTLGALEQNPDFFGMSASVTKLHFIAMAVSIDTAVIIGHQ